ncbi:MAG TPA: CGNR zinc finger domain-containing protein [Euzebyales bacterium]|nr:CGNR zinc finger domain-containing protein [Euzebyales bacterium]
MAYPPEPMRQPSGRKPAPDRLSTVQDFINTRDIEGQHEHIGTADELDAWLRQRRLLDSDAPACTDDDVRRAHALREALRQIAAANHDLSNPAPGPVAVVEDSARRAALTLTFSQDGGWRLDSDADGSDRAFGRLLAIMYDAIRSDRWQRLKACSRDACRWVFWDGSPNHKGRWCSMAICGNRSKVAAYRRRTDS